LRLRQLFVSDTGALHPPWRIVVFCIATVGALIVSAVIVGPLITRFFRLMGVVGVTNEAWVEAAGLLGGTALAVRVLDKRSWREVWLDSDAARPSLLSLGFALGALAIAIPMLGLIAIGWLDHDPSAPGSWFGAMSRISLLLLPAALMEELLTRGYILSVLREWWGWRAAVFATSVGFGLLHLSNNGATPGSVAMVTLAGFFLAAVLYVTKSLYATWMAHFAWNWTIAAVFHSAVSGYPLESPDYRYVDAGPDWATGGEWGPEGGFPAALGMIAGMALLIVGRDRYLKRAAAITATHNDQRLDSQRES
jgi:uncharacterized protein